MTIEASSWLKRFCEDHAVILGSSSQWRRKVLSQAGCRIVDAWDPAIDEKAIRHDGAEALVLAISHAKADALINRSAPGTVSQTERFLICTDQVALCDGLIREKPENEEQAREFIHSYSVERKPVETCSGVVVVDLHSGHREEGTYYNKIFFNEIPLEIVDQIVAQNVVYTCCGGFSVDWPLMGQFVSCITGAVDGVMGMPLCLLEDLFKRHQAKRVSL